MHDWISEFQLTSSAAAHGKTNQQTQVSSREEFFFFFFLISFCLHFLWWIQNQVIFHQEGKEFCTET